MASYLWNGVLELYQVEEECSYIDWGEFREDVLLAHPKEGVLTYTWDAVSREG